MATLTIQLDPPAIPVSQYRVNYRVKGSAAAYTTYLPPPYSGNQIVITGLQPATEYEGTISSQCGTGFSILTAFSTCTCPAGFTRNDPTGDCRKIETMAPVVQFSNYCLVTSTDPSYASYVSRIYNPGFNSTSIAMQTAPAGDVYAEMVTPGLWKSSSAANGPMNRAAVWTDSNCDGTLDPVVVGAKATVAAVFNNTGSSRTIYVGVAGDNSFDLKVNGVLIATCASNLSSVINFNIWHIFPVVVRPGFNDINAVATSSGGVDAVAMTIYDNTKEQLVAATTEAALTIPFSTQLLRGTHIDIATCADPAYTLDTSGGVGNYMCRKITNTPCAGFGAM